MNPLRSRIHRLVDRLPEDDLERVWIALLVLYYDAYMLRAIQEGQQTLTPGDSLTREEALRALLLF